MTKNITFFQDHTEEKMQLTMDRSTLHFKTKEKSCELFECEDNLRWVGSNGTFVSPTAELDNRLMRGVFRGTEVDPLVHYSGHWPPVGKATCSLDVSCGEVTLAFDTQKKGQNPLIPKEVHAYGDVLIDYDKTYTLASQEAHSELNFQENGKTEGVLHFIHDCHLKSQTESEIDASEMSIDLTDRVATFQKPHGKVQLGSHFGNENSSFIFSSDWMRWDEKKSAIVFKGNVKAQMESFGKLETTDTLEIFYSDAKGKKEIETIISNGHIEIVGHYGTPPLEITAICDGTLLVDQNKKELLLQSEPSSQVLVRSDHGVMQANTLRLRYQIDGGKFQATTLELDGSVKMRNHYGVDTQNPGPLDQFILSDHVRLDIPSQKVEFFADSGRRMLFYDRINNVKMSAPMVIMSRDPLTGKDKVEGKGDVRFTFMETEIDLLKKTFLH